jgi:CO/xanthine dehydrogenase FAD-binding subunit
VRPAAAVLGDHGLARVKVNCAFALARAATAAMQGARGERDNVFKIELARRTIVRALREAKEKA